MPPLVPDPIPDNMWIKEVLDRHHQDIKDQNAFVVMMTGRPYKIHRRIQDILNSKNINFHQEYYRGMPGQKGQDTFNIKVNIMENELFHDNLKLVEIFEDRPEHLSGFIDKVKRWKSLIGNNLEKIIIHGVSDYGINSYEFKLIQ
jgi:hypothetical protein